MSRVCHCPQREGKLALGELRRITDDQFDQTFLMFAVKDLSTIHQPVTGLFQPAANAGATQKRVAQGPVISPERRATPFRVAK